MKSSPRLFALLFFAICPLLLEAQDVATQATPEAGRHSGWPEGVAAVELATESTMLGYTVPVEVDGKEVRLIFDTGAAGTILAPATAKRLGLKAERNGSVISITGQQVKTEFAVSRRITLGQAWTSGEPVMISPLPDGADGLLGVATLADWDVRLDPAAGKLVLFPAGKAPALKGESSLPLAWELASAPEGQEHPKGFQLMNLRIPVRAAGTDIQAVPDTGYGYHFQVSSVLLANLAPAALRAALPGLHTGVSLSGDLVSRSVKLPELVLGPDTLKDLHTDVVEAAPDSSLSRLGVVGLGLLRHYVSTFSFSRKELHLKPLGTVQDVTHVSTAGILMIPGPEGRFLISDVVPGGPASKAGLKAGDEMLEIAGEPLRKMTPEKMAAFKQLPPGSAVKVRYRRGAAEPAEVALVLVKE